MARKSRTYLQEQGKVRGITNKEIESMKDNLKHFSFNTQEDSHVAED